MDPKHCCALSFAFFINIRFIDYLSNLVSNESITYLHNNFPLDNTFSYLLFAIGFAPYYIVLKIDISYIYG